MTEFVRRLVSGSKARFRDPDLDLELDLAYVTDQVIVMGYPSVGLEGLYRNRREDAQRFLTSRHGNNFWVFNFCPVKENSYDSSVFGGRVSRYPFPDHHSPPFAILPLVSREIHAWVSGSKDRVAVLHCKAGKGRSGTLACAYLLSLDTFPPPWSLKSTNFEKDWISVHVDDRMQEIPNDATPEELGEGTVLSVVDESFLESSEEGQSIPSIPVLQQVLDLHTSRRMKVSSISTKTSSSKPRKGKPGVSIPSQRRWLLYWSRLLAGQGPPGMWGLPDVQSDTYSSSSSRRKVRITEISLHMRELSGIKTGLVRTASFLMDRGKDRDGHIGPDNDRVWASLARYDDGVVSALERWEKQTRDSTGLGKREKSSEPIDDVFSSGKWDEEKMVQTFGRMEETRESRKLQLEPNGENEDVKVYTYILHTLSDSEEAKEVHSSRTSVAIGSGMAGPQMTSQSKAKIVVCHNGIIVSADRELRIKFYMGQVLMTWMWLIPSFHMAPEMPLSSIILAREELDFPIGIGKDIVDVTVKMEWCRDDADYSDAQGEMTPLAWDHSSELASDVEVGRAVDTEVGPGEVWPPL